MTLKFKTGSDVQSAHDSWFRGDSCNYNPTKTALRAPGGISEYVLKGWVPTSPFITRESVVTAFGSCFAQNISRWLKRQRYLTGLRLAIENSKFENVGTTHVVRFGEGLVNTFSLLQQFEWAYEGRTFGEELWFAGRGGAGDYSESIRKSTRLLFESTEVFIITLGLAEVWCNVKSGEVFWRAIPKEKFDPCVHGFRVTSVQENVDNLSRIIEIISAHRPEAAIIFTLSPIPLVATFRSVGCITANAVSKAILRVAIDEVMRGHPKKRNLYYWPAYEIIKEFIVDPYGEDNRHPRQDAITLVLEEFSRHFLVDAFSHREIEKLADRARAEFGRFLAVGSEAIESLIENGIYHQDELRRIPERTLAGIVGSEGLAARIRLASERAWSE